MTQSLEQMLFRLTYAEGKNFGLVAYADAVVLDTSTAPPAVCAIRLGGEPEQVQAMAAIIQGGGTIMADLGAGPQKLSCMAGCYRRQLIRDGPYAQALLTATEEVLKHPKKKDSGQEDQEKPRDDEDDQDVNQRDKKLKGLPAYQVEESDDVAPPRKLYFYTHVGDVDALFSAIDAKTAVPLTPEFQGYVLAELEDRGILRRLETHTKGADIDAWVLECDKDDANLIKVVEEGLRGGDLIIPGAAYTEEDVAGVNTVTDYLNAFGTSIAERIREQFVPLYDPATERLCPELLEVSDYIKAHAGYHLYDAQMAVAEAVVRQHRRSKCAIVVAECGVGKTKIGAAALYASLAQSFKRGGPQKTLNVILCPAHIKKKWVREIEESLPNTFAVIVHNMAEVDSAVRRYELGDQSCYLILGKEAARDGYMRAPAVIARRPNVKRTIMLERGETESWYEKGPYQFYCPDCGELVHVPQKKDEGEWPVADQFFFLRETEKNHKCPRCGSPFWTALNPGRQTEWVKIGNYGFIHRYGAQAHLTAMDEDLPPAVLQKIQMVADHPEAPYPAIGARRAYPLSSYIKRTLRGRLNCVVADELQDYNNDSGQGDAMGELFGAAKYFIGLTGTLINGYSSGMFHLLYRVAAPRMVEDGKPYDVPGQFNYEYGVIQYITRTEEVEYAANRRSTVTSTITKQVPGVSPLVFTRFLMETTAFLTLKDLGKALPEYEEIPVPMPLEDHIQQAYRGLEKTFKNVMMKDRRIARRVQSAFMNLLLSYPDQSYGQRTIFHPKEKTPLVEPAQLGTIDDLRPKDIFVLDKVAEKIANGEHVVIYTSWVRLDTQKKLAGLLRSQGISVQILTASVPTEKREDWLDKKVAEGVQVLITNPTLVSTGLDLLAFANFIFYDMGNKLFDLRQSSRRGLRLNQEALRIEVYLLYYAETQQQNLIKLMASKLATANMIEGGYSEEGLSAMCETEDTTTILARELMMGIRSSVEDIGAAFKKMALLHPEEETTGAEPEETVEAQVTDIVDVSEPPVPVVLPERPAPVEPIGSAGRVYTAAEVAAVLLSNRRYQQRRQRKEFTVDGQLSIFEAAS